MTANGGTRATLVGLAAVVLVAVAVLGRFTLEGEVLLPTDILSITAPYARPAPPPRNRLNFDPVLSGFPRARATGEALRAGKGAPRWNPQLALGEPLELHPDPGSPDYPPWRLAYALLPAWVAHSTLVVFHLALALAGTFLLLRPRGVEAALVGACVYGLSGLLSVWLLTVSWEISASWIPWTLVGLELAARRGPRWLALAALATGASFLGGGFQTASLGLLLAAAWPLVLLPRPRVRSVALAWTALALGLGIASVRLWPAVVELRESNRDAPAPFERWLHESATLTPDRLVLLVAPEALGDPVSGTAILYESGRGYESPLELRISPGIVGLALALAAAFARANRRAALLALAILVLAMPTPLAWPLWRTVIGVSAATRVLQLLPIPLALLVAAGFRGLKRGEVRLAPWLLALVVVLAGGVATGLLVPSAPAGALAGRAVWKPLGLAVAALAVAALVERPSGRARPWPKLARALLAALLVFDLAEATARWNVAGPPGDLYRPTSPLVDRARELQGDGRVHVPRGILPPALMPLGFRTVGTYGGACPGRTVDLLDAVAPAGKRSKQLVLAKNLPRPWLDALAVRAVLLPTYLAPPTFEGLAPLGSSATVVVYANPTALARARLVPQSRVSVRPDETSALARVREATFDPRREVVVEVPGETSDAEPASAPAEAVCRIVVDGPEHVRVEGSAEEPCWLVLADAFASGWRASVDGQPVAVRPGDVALRAVAFPAGTHAVDFDYEPPTWPWAPLASVVALLATGLLFLGRSTRRSSRVDEDSVCFFK